MSAARCAGSFRRRPKCDSRILRPSGEPFDAQIAISSLPRAFGTRLETIPASIPYLSAEPGLREIWFKRIGAEGFKVGVVWQGNPNPEADRAPLHAARGARAACQQSRV